MVIITLKISLSVSKQSKYNSAIWWSGFSTSVIVKLNDFLQTCCTFQTICLIV